MNLKESVSNIVTLIDNYIAGNDQNNLNMIIELIDQLRLYATAKGSVQNNTNILLDIINKLNIQ